MNLKETSCNGLFSAKTLNTLFEGNRVAVFHTANDSRMTITEISDSISVFGYSSKKIVTGKKGWLDILYPDDSKTFEHTVKSDAQNGQAEGEHDYRILTGSGEILWVSCFCTAEKNDGGKTERFLVTIKDISERKRREEKLKKTDSAIHSVFDHSVDGMMLADEDGRICEWNHGYELISGLSREAVLDRTVWEAMAYFFVEDEDEDGRAKLEAEMRQVLTDMKQRMFFRHVINRETGISRVVSSRCFPVVTNSAKMLGIISYDITELMRSWDLIFNNENNFDSEKRRLITLANHIPGGCLFRFIFNRKTGRVKMSYVSATWENLTGIPADVIKDNFSTLYTVIHRNDRRYFKQQIDENTGKLSNFTCEIRVLNKDSYRWLQLSAHPHQENTNVVWEGIILDITQRKEAEKELVKYKENLEFIAMERTEKLEIAYEELRASNEELHGYKTKLEKMVEEKVSEIVAHKILLENISSRQAILIKILQIVQSVENLSTAIDMSLSEVGKFVKVSRIYTFEKNIDGKTFICTHEWHNADIISIIEELQNMSAKTIQPWFDMYNSENFICTSDISTVNFAGAVEAMEAFGIKATISFPLSANGVNYGFVAFDDCRKNRKWESDEIELLKSLSQIISGTTHRRRAETAIRMSQQTMRKVLDNVESGVFVIDMETSKIIFANKEFKDREGYDIEGKICYKLVDPESTKNCDFCPRAMLVEGNRPSGQIYKWEYHHTNGRWYEEISTAVEWIDGRTVQIENSIDITERKLAEQAMIEQKNNLEEVRRRQAILIKVLQMVQSTENLPEAMNLSLAEIGKYGNASRVYVFERNFDENAVECTYEWCKKGVAPIMEHYKDLPREYFNAWVDLFDSTTPDYYQSDIKTLSPQFAHTANKHKNLKSFVLFPFLFDSHGYIVVGFDECTKNRKWEPQELELLRSLSQILASTTRRHRAETTIRLSQQSMHTVLDNIESGIYVIDVETSKIIFNNRYTEERIGKDGGGKICWQTLQAGQTDVCDFCPRTRMLADRSYSEKPYRWEYQQLPSGRWYEEFSSIIKWIDGRKVQIENSIDITDRKMAEEAIIEQKNNLEKIRRRQTILIKVLQMVQSTENLNEILNLSLAEIGKHTGVSRVYVYEKNSNRINTVKKTYEWSNNSKSDSHNYLNAPRETVTGLVNFLSEKSEFIYNSGDSFAPELKELLNKHSKARSILLIPVLSLENSVIIGLDDNISKRNWEQDELELLQSLSQIISNTIQRYRAETAVHLSLQTMRTVLDNLKTGIYVVDVDTSKILFANRHIKERTCENYLEERICWQTLQPEQSDICELCPRRDVFSDKDYSDQPVQWEYRQQSTGRWYEELSSIIYWIDGRKVQLENSIDITDRKLVEIELISAKEKAEESDKLKSAFLANMSHEVRTPINGINGFLTFIADENISAERRREYIGIVKNSSKQLLRIIDDIIDMSKIEAQQLIISPKPFNLNEFMLELQLFFETLTGNQNKKISLILDNSGFIDNCIINGDRTRLRQVITNLIENAFKFTDKGYINFGYSQISPTHLKFWVEDTGIGLPGDQLEVIFERFRQVELTSQRKYGGTGLGLTISQNIVQLMGGKIWVESIEGQGASFYFTVPYVSANDEKKQIN